MKEYTIQNIIIPSPMKKALSFFTALLITMSGCFLTSEAPPPEPLSFDTEMTESDISFFTEGDDIETLLASTPYYISAVGLSMPAFKQFDELKRAKVQEAQNLTDELYAKAQELESQLIAYKVAYHQFISVAYDHEPKVEDFAQDAAGQFLEFNLKEAAAKLKIENTEKQNSADPLISSFFEYEKTTATLQFIGALYHDLGFLFGNSGQLAAAFESHENAEITAALGTFNNQMGKIEELNTILTTLNQKSAELDMALKQLDTAEYLMGQASLAFMQEQMPNLKAQLATLQPSEQLSAEDIEFITEYTGAFETFANELDSVMSQADKSDLLPVPSSTQTGLFPTAHAGFTDTMSSAFDVLGQGAGMMLDGAVVVGKGAKLAWQGSKTTVGVGLDILDAHAASVFDVGFGLYSGEEMKSIGNRVVENYVQVKDNFEKGASGSKVLKTAGQYFDNIEDSVDKNVAATVTGYVGEGEIGKGTSWLAGKVAKLTTGMFTQLGKGIYKVADTQATTGEVVEGMIDIGFSFIGGSQVVLKTSQGAKGGWEGIKLLGKKGINFTKDSWNKASIANLKGIYAQAVAQGGDDAARLIATLGDDIARREALSETLDAARQALSDDIGKAVKEAGETVFENLKKNAPKSYDDFVKTMYGDDTLLGFIQGMKSAIDDVTGTTLRDYFDNLAGNVIDDLLKGAIKDVTESIFGKLGGTYSGTLFIDEGVTLPIALEVDGPIITGNMNTTLEIDFLGEPLSIVITANIKGAVDEKMKILCNISGSAMAGGDTIHFTGSFDGTVDETTMNVTNLQFVVDGEVFGGYGATLTKA